MTLLMALLFAGGCMDDITKNADLTEGVVKIIPYTVSASAVGDDTKVYADVDGFQRFEVGDKLVITGENISGTLTLRNEDAGKKKNATFEGTLEWSGPEDEPDPDLELSARLISLLDVLAGLESFTGAFTDLTAEAVQKYSLLTATSSYRDKSFSLCQGTSFISFKVSFDPAPADGSYEALATNGAGATTLATGNVGVEDGLATFTLALPGGILLDRPMVTIKGNAVKFAGSEPKRLTAGALYRVNKTMIDELATPLTLQAVGDGTIITVTNPLTKTIAYTINGKNRRERDDASFTISINKDDLVQFYGDNAAYASPDEYIFDSSDLPTTPTYSNIKCSADCYVYGNIMSLIQSSDFAGLTTLSAPNAFFGLLADMNVKDMKEDFESHLLSHPSRVLLLPATTITPGCYAGLFAGSAMTHAPELPATTLAKSCYVGMYMFCSSLTTPPALPATTLAPYCYAAMFGLSGLTSAPEINVAATADWCCSRMFYGCQHLTTVPEVLPATTLAPWCYDGMFGESAITQAPRLPATVMVEGCYNDMFEHSSLVSAPVLPAETLAANCYEEMFEGCADLVSAPELRATEMAPNCYEEMFKECTSLTQAPALSSTELAPYCYNNMFYGCSSLTDAPALPATELENGCYLEMFSQCTSLTDAPDLPAAALKDSSYFQMFIYCSNLNYIKCLATDRSASSCTDGWVGSVAPTGLFIMADGMKGWSIDSVDGVPPGWTPVEEKMTVPMTLEAFYVDAMITINNPLNLDIYYRIDDGAMQHYDRSFYLLPGQAAHFYGNNNYYAMALDVDDDDWAWTTFTCSTPCYLYGNVMSLLNENVKEYAGNTTIPSQYCFAGLFNCEYEGSAERVNPFIFNHPVKDFYLPATTLTEGCYAAMFDYCTKFERAPALPATTLFPSCYESMFYGCESLIEAPVLPATTMEDHCYADMFGDCESLTTAPDLLASDLAHRCYSGMFYNCSSLKYLKCLATTNIYNATKEWMVGVASGGTFVKAPSAEWSRGIGDRNIPDSWTVVDAE